MKHNFYPNLTLILAVILLSWPCLVAAQISHKNDTLPATAQKVYTGIYLMNVYDINISDHSFYADFYIWFKWKGDRDPLKIEFVNAIEKWGMTQTLFYDSTKTLANGYQYNGMRVEGRFYHPFDMARFPLDQHALSIEIEHTEYPYDSLLYLPDTLPIAEGNAKAPPPAAAANLPVHRPKQINGLYPNFQLPGWEISGLRYQAHQNTYGTNFGDTDASETVYGNFTFSLDIARPLNYFWFKLLLPLLVVLIASLGGMLIFPTYVEARISLPIGGLLTAVFLQQAYSDALPDVGYMVLMDKIYVMSYLLITVVMLQLIWIGNLVKTNKKNVNSNRVSRWELFMALLYASFYAMGLFMLIKA